MTNKERKWLPGERESLPDWMRSKFARGPRTKTSHEGKINPDDVPMPDELAAPLPEWMERELQEATAANRQADAQYHDDLGAWKLYIDGEEVLPPEDERGTGGGV